RDRAGGGPFGPPREGGDELALPYRRQVVAQRAAEDTPLAESAGEEDGLALAAAAALEVVQGRGDHLGPRGEGHAAIVCVGCPEPAVHATQDWMFRLGNLHFKKVN